MTCARCIPTREHAIRLAALPGPVRLARPQRTVARPLDTSPAKAAYLKSP